MAKNKRESIEVTNNGYTIEGNEFRIRDSDDTSAGDITMKIDVDVSEALTGLKAVERQAKAATRALRELEGVQTRFDKNGNMTMNGAKITFPGDEVE